MPYVALKWCSGFARINEHLETSTTCFSPLSAVCLMRSLFNNPFLVEKIFSGIQRDHCLQTIVKDVRT
uniref:Uncharacterized protein n=1 Tax=Rhizophora mucronata TaxID=61149 RepID=A0A2P2K8F2_RHIMU